MEILLLIVFAILGFAFYGFVCFCKWVTTPSDKPPSHTEPRSGLRFDETTDVRGAERLLNHLYVSNKVDDDQYNRIRDILERDYKEALLKARLRKTSDGAFVATKPPAQPKAELPTEVEPIQFAELVHHPPSPVHPLDAPDETIEEPEPPSPPEPRRSFAEMLAGFMEKRNIRWGELASGLLIVGSAVGLVISLREELRDRIPYFSALVFMLITAAIHGAGTYTLKRWKLRNTSRGVLLIGMLLIPLNFLAASLLNGSPEQRRSLSDPLLWLAVVVGIAAYSAMSWFSTRNLFRIRHLATAVCVVASGVSILVANRLDGFSNSIVATWLLAFFCFAAWHVSVLLSAPKILHRNYASKRFRDRLLTIAGIGLFALICVVAMLLIRSEDRLRTLLTLTPLIASVGIAAVCVGDRLFGKQNQTGEEVAETTSLVGRSVNLVGWAVLVLSIAGSLFHPLVAFAAGAIVVLMASAIRYYRRIPGLATAAWVSLSATILIAAAAITQRVALETWSNLPQLASALSHSQSGIALMLTGAIALLAAVVWKRQTGEVQIVADSRVANLFPEPVRQFSVAKIFAGAAVIVGLAWLALSSGLHRQDWLDVNLGTAMLVTVAAGGMILNAGLKLTELTKTGLIAALVLAGCHLLYWNPFFSEFLTERSWLSKTATGFDVRLISLSAVCALLIAVSSFVERKRLGASSDDPLRIACWILTGLAIVAALMASPFQSSWTIVCLLAVGVANGLLFASADSQKDQRFSLQLRQVLQTLIVVALIANLTVKTGIASSLDSANHAMLQFGVLSIGTALAHRSRTFLGWGDWKWLSRSVAITFLAWFAMGVANECFVELVADYSGEVVGWLNLADSMWPLIVTGAVVFFGQLLIADPETETLDGVLGGLSLVAVITAVGMPFSEAHAVATVCRWLVPIAVGIVAILIGSRKLLPDRSRSLLMVNAKETSQQTIINVLLSVAVIVVLGISTITIARFLLIGAESLGGPLKGTWFGDMRKDVSFGGPIGLIVATFLWFAITERRCFLAMAGSGVFQYVVLLSIVLLFLSPHPKLASSWFINIMQAISFGMTGYGLVWLWQRSRIGEGKVDFGMTEFFSRWKMLDAHAIINVILVLSMVVLIFQRYFFYPTISGDWITSAGSWLGVVTAIFVSVFVCLLWKRHLGNLFDLIMMLGCLAIVAFVAAAVDRIQSGENGFIPWSSYRTLACGSLTTVGLLLGKTLLKRSSEPNQFLSLRTELSESQSKFSRVAIGVAIGVSFLFCIFGVDADVNGSWVYLAGSGLLIFAMACHAYFFCSWFVGFAVLPMVWIFAGQLTLRLGSGLQDGLGPSGFDIFLARLGATGLVAALWIAIDWISIRLKRAPMDKAFFLMPNLVTLVGSILALGTSTFAIAMATEWVAPSVQPGRFHLLATLGVGVAWIAGFWSRKGHFRLFAGLLTAGSVVTLAMCLLPDSVLSKDTMRAALIILSWALTFFLAANVWARFDTVKRLANRLQVVGVEAMEFLLRRRLPFWIFGVGLFVYFLATLIVWNDDWKASRVTASFAALTMAASLIVYSLRKPLYRIQLSAILASVAGFVLLSVSGEGVTESVSGGLAVYLRGLLVPALSVFLFGVFATRWLRAGDSWEEPIRDATAALTVTTFAGAFLFLFLQNANFDHDLGSGIGVPRALSLLAVLLAMVLGLLMIAVVPKRDPFSMSLEGRQGYVYAAQVFTVIAGAHVYLSMPWLLKTGILQYWPYLAIVVSLAGLGVSELLKRRGLEVLSEPIFNTAALIPVLVAMGYWLIDSKANAALTFLLSGLIYLGIAVRFQALWSAAMAMILGNISLWLFYSQQSVSFTNHPQLWLIPPAICVLLATWLDRKRFSEKQLTAIRYGCVFVIYLSSTSEILINGIGQQIWPPLVLAVLSIAGMAAGIMLQVRSFLFVGVSFLFVAVIAMVSHAQQSLDHVWPWWAFGILTGAGILVVFGLFEKRRNDLVRIGKQMREWEG